MRSFLPWACAAAFQSVAQTADVHFPDLHLPDMHFPDLLWWMHGNDGNVDDTGGDWCGEVQDDGSTWVHDSNPDCGGKGTIAQNKCWLRKGVEMYNCKEDENYDYWVQSNYDNNEYEEFPGRNCYAGQGVASGSPDYGRSALSLGLGGCKHSCSLDPECEGIIVYSPEHMHQQELRIHKCWLRSGIRLSRCANKSMYDTFFHSKLHPADFSQHQPGVNCYAGVGADSSYGTSELKYPDGTRITHLGECKAACHSDAGRCEGITVLFDSDRNKALAGLGAGAEPEPGQGGGGLLAAAAATPPAAVSQATSWLAPAGLCLGFLSAACAAAAVVRRAPSAGDRRGLALVQPEAEGASDDA